MTTSQQPLYQQQCTACTPDSPMVAGDKASTLLAALPGWNINTFDSVEHLVKAYQFENFTDAMTFTVGIGELAEEINHHPTIITTWGKVTIHWWTHSINGLHHNDFIMAAKTDKLFESVAENN